MRINLPWPPARLRPNASRQGSWRAKSEAAKKYRADCLLMARRQVRGWNGAPLPLMLDMTFHGPDRRRRDLDNLLAMTKQGIDAISEIIGIDDSEFEYTLRRGEPVKGGAVVVVL